MNKKEESKMTKQFSNKNRYSLLKGKNIAITRNELDAREFSELVSSAGGRTIALPTIDIVSKAPSIVEEFLDSLYKNRPDYCAFMSSQAVRVLFNLCRKGGNTERIISALNSINVIAVGPVTKQSLITRGIKVGLMPRNYSSVGLVKLLSERDVKNKKIIIPRSGTSGEFAASTLTDLGLIVYELFLYSVKTSSPSKNWVEFIGLLEEGKVDALVFTSTSAVKSFFEIIQKIATTAALCQPGFLNKMVRAVISIGPFTSAELLRKGVTPYEAEKHTIAGTFDAAKHALHC